MLLFGSRRKPMPQYLSSSLNMLCSCFYHLLVWLFVFPLLFGCLLQNLAAGLTRHSWGRLERRSTVAEAVMNGIYTLPAEQTGTLPRQPKICLSSGWMSYPRFNKGCGQADLCRIHHDNQRLPKRFGICYSWLSARACRDVHSQLWSGRLLQEGAVRSKPGGVLVCGPAWRGTDGLQDPWQPWLRYDLEKFKKQVSVIIRFKKAKCLP